MRLLQLRECEQPQWVLRLDQVLPPYSQGIC